jgi:hypothetical protein
MKILELNPCPPPRIPPWFGKVFDCENCHSKYQIDSMKDVKYISTSILREVKCPVCGCPALFEGGSDYQ